jgi:hypothetical protein
VRDQRFANRNATTVVPARIFANAGPVAPAARQIPRPVVQQAVQQAPVSVRPPQLAPASARANAMPTGPRAPGGPAARGAAQAPAAAIPGAPGVVRPPGGPAGGPPINGVPGIAGGPAAPGRAGPHQAAHQPPAQPNARRRRLRPHPAPGVAHAPPPGAADRARHGVWDRHQATRERRRRCTARCVSDHRRRSCMRPPPRSPPPQYSVRRRRWRCTGAAAAGGMHRRRLPGQRAGEAPRSPSGQRRTAAKGQAAGRGREALSGPRLACSRYCRSVERTPAATPGSLIS